MGRFISADAFTATGQGLLGNNMFAYCNNNPACCSDPTGYWSTFGRISNPNAMMRGGGCYEGWIIPDREREAEELARQAMDPRNTNPEAVLQADYFAFYKGIPVIRTNGTRSGSFGFIFLTRETNSRLNPEDMLYHEYGHVVQLSMLGPIAYALCIFIPSWQMWGSDDYYEKPWEVTADVFGGVQHRNPPADKITAGLLYLERSQRFGPLVWLTID